MMEDRISHWTFRDIFLSFGIALDPILLAIGYVGVLVGGAAYGFLYFLGNATGTPTPAGRSRCWAACCSSPPG